MYLASGLQPYTEGNARSSIPSQSLISSDMQDVLVRRHMVIIVMQGSEMYVRLHNRQERLRLHSVR